MTLPAVCSKVTLVLVERVLLGGPVPLDLPGDGHERPVHLLGDFRIGWLWFKAVSM